MSSTRAFQIASRLALGTTVVMFCLVVVGSVVRTTGSGLACPDWPLCQGRLIPAFEPHVLVEWFHRLLALAVSVLLLATVGWTLAHPALRARLGGLATLAVALLAAQIVLGGLTVLRLLDPSVVSSHLAVALLLFSTLLTFTLVAQTESEATPGEGAVPPPARPAGLLPVIGFTTVLAYVQCVLGAVVSTNGAGLACPDWPTCNGEWLPAMQGLVAFQMVHRFGAYALLAATVFAVARVRSAPDAGARAAASMALGLVVAQIALGVSNVILGTPVWLSALHLANAAGLLAMLVTATYRVSLLPASDPRLAPARAGR